MQVPVASCLLTSVMAYLMLSAPLYSCVRLCMCCVQIIGRTPYGLDLYMLSNADLNFASPNFTNGVGAYEPILNGAEYGQKIIDYGASESPCACCVHSFVK